MNKTLKTIFILSVIGTLFALTVTLRQYLAPTNEPGLLSCVGLKIFGLSPCPYGLTFFILLTLSSRAALLGSTKWFSQPLSLRLLALAGATLAGWVGWREIGLPWLLRGQDFLLTFSLAKVTACVWGFFVFLAVAILSLSWRSKPKIN